MPGIGEISQKEAVSAALIRRTESLKKSTNHVDRVASRMKVATRESWFTDLTEARRELRKGVNRVGIDKIQGRLDQIDTNGSIRRKGVEDNLLSAKKFAEQGYETLDSAQQQRIRDEVTKRVQDIPELRRRLKAAAKAGEADEFVDKMVRDPRFRGLTQDRLRGLVDSDPFTDTANKVKTQREAVQIGQDNLDQAKANVDEAIKTRDKKKTAADAFADGGTKKQALESAQSEIDTDPNQTTKESEFNRLYTEQQQRRQRLAELQVRASQSNLTPGEKKQLHKDINNITSEIDTTEATFTNNYKPYLERRKLLDEQTRAQTELAESETKVTTAESKLQESEKNLKEQQEKLTELESRYKAIEDEFIADAENIYGWAAGEYIDDRISEYIEVFQNTKPEYVNEIVKRESDALYAKLHDRWFRNKIVGRGKTFNRRNIRNDMNQIFDEGPDAYLKGLGITDSELLKQLGPQVSRDILRMANDNDMLSSARLAEMQTLPWAKDLIDQMRTNSEFSESLDKYNNGDKENLLWLALLVGGQLAVEITKQDDDEEE